MLAWLISLVMLFAGCANGNVTLVITSGLFAIAGNISMVFYQFSNALSKTFGQDKQNNPDT